MKRGRGGVDRIQRITSLIQVALAEILLREMEDARFHLTTITGVEVAKDLSLAKVHVSTLDDDEEKAKEIIAALNHAAKYIRHALAKHVELRVVPELKFYYDSSSLHGHRISALLNSAIKKSDQ